MSNTLSGMVSIIGDTEQITDTFKKRELVIKTDEKYPQDVSFQFANDKGALLDNVTEGENVTVHFNVRGKEYNGRHFVNLDGWKIDVKDNQELPVHAAKDENDLPF